MRITHQALGLPGDAEAALRLGANRGISHELPECISEIPVEFVPAVPSNLLSEQARADPQCNSSHNRVCIRTLGSLFDQVKDTPCLYKSKLTGTKTVAQDTGCPLRHVPEGDFPG
jgi:hypothetical protein